MSPTGQDPGPDRRMPKPIHGLLDSLIEQLAAAIAARAEQMFARSGVGSGRRAGIRMCPYPGCKNPGAGPRNRWFCQEHARSVPVREQKRILAARAESGGSSPRLARKRRGASPFKGKKLDMSCRVEGCKNVSKGPRFGFLCAK